MKHGKSWRDSSTYQMLLGDRIVPRYIPFGVRLRLMILRGIRSWRKHRHALSLPPVPDPVPRLGAPIVLGPGRGPCLNVSYSRRDADLADPSLKAAVLEIETCRDELARQGLKATSAAGTFKSKDFIPDKEKNKMWENAWLLSHMDIRPGDNVLDLGGASTVLTFTLARRGIAVTVVDNDWGFQGIVDNARHVARRMRWPLSVIFGDLSRPLPFATAAFDKVFCVCVLEHLPAHVRRTVMAEIGRVLKPGGLAGLTIDHDPGRRDAGLDQGLRFGLPERLTEDVIRPSGLEIYGNGTVQDDIDAGKFFLGTLFLKKPEGQEGSPPINPAFKRR